MELTEIRAATDRGDEEFIVGANFTPTDNWWYCWNGWHGESVAENMRICKEHGLNDLRVFLLWPYFQPDPGVIAAEPLSRLEELARLAGRCGMRLYVTLINGWLSGPLFDVSWRKGRDVYSDPFMLDACELLVRTIARRLRDYPCVAGYDLGNEINCAFSCKSDEGASAWMERMTAAIRDEHPGVGITNGVDHQLIFRDIGFDVFNVGRFCDYIAVHTYPYFTGVSALDPWSGLRPTYLPSFMIEFAKLGGKKVMVQEIGCSQAWAPIETGADFLRVTLVSTWIAGAIGYFWWSSHDVDRRFTLDELEYSLGLFSARNEPKLTACTVKEWAEVLRSLGTNWREVLPKCAIVVGRDYYTDPAENVKALLNAYILAKQAHFDARFVLDGEPLSGFAAAVVPGRALSDGGRKVLTTFVRNGGRVYQSGVNDFWSLENWRSLPGYGLVAELGAGRIHYNPDFVESGLWRWNPWATDRTDRWYALMRPPAPDISCKYVELSIKEQKNRRLFLLVNHHGEAEEAELHLGKEAVLRDLITGRAYPRTDILQVSLDASGVLLLEER